MAVMPLLFGLLVGLAFASPSHAAPPDSASAPASASSGAPAVEETYSGRVLREIEVVQKQNKVVIGTVVLAALFLLVALALLVIAYARKANKMKFAMGFLEFEIDEATRKATERADAAEKRAQVSERTVLNLAVLIHTLRAAGASVEPRAYVGFLAHCAEESAATVKRSGTVQASIWVPHNGRLRIVTGYRVPRQTIDNFSLSATETGFAWDVFTSKKPQIKSRSREPGAIRENPHSQHGIEWIIGVPIWEDEGNAGVAGVLCVSDEVDEAMSKADVGVCNFYANLAATALRIAKLRGVALL